MDAIQTIINAGLAGLVTTAVWFITRAQTSALDRRLDRHEDRTEARFERLEAKIDAKTDALRADITQLAFRLGERPHPQTG